MGGVNGTGHLVVVGCRAHYVLADGSHQPALVVRIADAVSGVVDLRLVEPDGGVGPAEWVLPAVRRGGGPGTWHVPSAGCGRVV